MKLTKMDVYRKEQTTDMDGTACGTVDYTVEILEKHHEKRKDS